MAASLKIKWKFPDWKRRVKEREEEINLFIAANMQTNRGMLFDASGSYNGHEKWKKLVLRQGQPLSKTGALRRSIGPMNDGKRPVQSPSGIVRMSGNTITIGTKLAYARMMNDGTKNLPGGVLRPIHAKALRIPLPGGQGATKVAKSLRKSEGKFMFRKSVKIPPRPFDTWTKEDQEELSEALREKLAEILNGK